MSSSKEFGDYSQDATAVLTTTNSSPMKTDTNKNYSTLSPNIGSTSISPNATPRKSAASASVTSPDITPKKCKRTFIFSSAFRPPFSKRTDNYKGPRLDPEQLSAHAFDPPSPSYDYRDRIKSPDYAGIYYRSLQLLPTPDSESSFGSDNLSWPSGSLGISTRSNATEFSNFSSPTDLMQSGFFSRIQSEKSESEDMEHGPVRPAYIRESTQDRVFAVFQQNSPMLTPPERAHPRSSPPIFLSNASSDSLETKRTISEFVCASISSQYFRPPSGTFRSSHAHKLRSELFADARESAKAAQAKKQIRRVQSDIISDLLQGPTIISSKACDNRSSNNEGIVRSKKNREEGSMSENEKEMEKVVLGISELDIFGVGMMKENTDRYTSMPWKRSVRARQIVRKLSDDAPK